MACEWDDIPDPNCFESCTPAPTCGSCDVGNIFKYPNPPLPGVPCGRVAVPLVRVNGQIQDLNAGGFIPNQFIEPPFLSYDPNSGFLNVGGRFVKINEGTNMAQSDCHGQQIGPCTPIMTCTNFAEIIGASTGVGFKNPTNPFAGLTIFLKENSGLVLDNGGLGINWSILCAKLVELGCSTSPNPNPNPNPGPTPTPNPDPGPGPTPTPNPDPTPTDQVRNGIPYYTCHNSTNNQVDNISGTVSITWVAATGAITVSGGTAGTKYFYSGSSGAAAQIGSTLGAGYTLTQFNAITMVALDSVCAVTPPDPGPNPDPTPDPEPTPPADRSVSNFACYQGTQPGEPLGSIYIHWDPSTGKVSVVGGSGNYYLYSGSSPTYTKVGDTDLTTFTEQTFGNITAVADDTTCN